MDADTYDRLYGCVNNIVNNLDNDVRCKEWTYKNNYIKNLKSKLIIYLNESGMPVNFNILEESLNEIELSDLIKNTLFNACERWYFRHKNIVCGKSIDKLEKIVEKL